MELDEAVVLGDEDQAAQAGTSVRARRRQETRAKLLRVASDLFSRSGFDQTTYDDIAREARVSRQTVFNHFPRKDDFAFEWGIRNRHLLGELLATPKFQKASATTRLVMIMRAMADVYDKSATQARALLHAWVRAGGPIREEPRLLGSVFEQVIRVGQKSGEFRSDLSAVTSGELIRAAYFDALYQWVGAEDRDDARDLFTSMAERVELILTGLRIPPPVDLRSA